MTKTIKSQTGSLVRASSTTIRFRFSSNNIDRHGSVVEPEGIQLKNWNRIFLWGHDGYGGWEAPDINNVMGKVVGKVPVVPFRKGSRNLLGLEGDVQFAREENPAAAMAEGLVRSGFLRDTSIGFRPLEKPVVEKRFGKEVPVYKKVELLEVSLVPIAANPDATSLLRSMLDYDPEAEEDSDGWSFDAEKGVWILRLPDGEEPIQLELSEALRCLDSINKRSGTTDEPLAPSTDEPEADFASQELVANAVRSYLNELKVARIIRGSLRRNS